jgi:hypothetical protein
MTALVSREKLMEIAYFIGAFVLVVKEKAVKYNEPRPYADPEQAARVLMEHAQAFEPIQDGRIYIEKINGPFLFADKGHASRVQGRSGLPLIEDGWKSTRAGRM